jgi:hypothetical protein
MQAAKEGTEKILLFVYYSGHGVMQNTTFLVLNESKNKERFFNIEATLETFTRNYKNTMAILILDCCREPIAKEQMRGGVP